MPGSLGVLRFRPCGACGAMVNVSRGCVHWRPATVTTGKGKMSGSDRRKRAKEKADQVAEFARMMGVKA